jgi:exopolysaccharide biosynthesis polyprenyl glycosylphosphotransferase
MYMRNQQESLLLLLGDVVIFTASIPLMLFVRYLELPSTELFLRHLEPFAILFLAWLIVFFVSGLYERHTLILKNRLPSRIFNAQVTNTVTAVFFFYLIPYFGITPKTNLFIYLIVSFGLILLWRFAAPKLLSSQKSKRALLVAAPDKVSDLLQKVGKNSYYNLSFVGSINPQDPQEESLEQRVTHSVESNDVEYVVADFSSGRISQEMASLHQTLYPEVFFVDITRVFENTVKRFPLSLITDEWCFRHLSIYPHQIYDFFKRVMDVCIASILMIISLPVYPLVALAIKLEDGGPVFIAQKRVGFNGQIVTIYKFRSMTTNDDGKWLEEEDNRITRVGNFLRKSRIDELPQLWNVLRGDLSLVGPRPDITGLWDELHNDIPYYEVRTLVRPGLSGWAQINQDEPPQSLESTKKRLSYDIYYVKNRSFFLDFKIALRTIATLLSRAGK